MNNYDDIIDFRYTGAERHARMPQISRAAQFAPFAAMVGHDAAIAEVERLTDKRIQLDEEAIRELDERLQLLKSIIMTGPKVTITYFKPDTRKEGGAYITASGSLSKIDLDKRCVFLSSGIVIPIDEIMDINAPLFDKF